MNTPSSADLLSCGRNTLICPSLRMGVAVRNKNTGSCLSEKSISLSGAASVLECLGALFVLCLVLRLACSMRRRRKKGKRPTKKQKIMSES